MGPKEYYDKVIPCNYNLGKKQREMVARYTLAAQTTKQIFQKIMLAELPVKSWLRSSGGLLHFQHNYNKEVTISALKPPYYDNFWFSRQHFDFKEVGSIYLDVITMIHQRNMLFR